MTDPTQTLPATPPAPPPAGGASAPQTIPYDRFRSVVAEKNSLTAQLAQMEAQLTAAQQRGATVDTLSQQLQQATTRATADNAWR